MRISKKLSAIVLSIVIIGGGLVYGLTPDESIESKDKLANASIATTVDSFNKDLAKIIFSSLVMFAAVMLCKMTLGFDGIVGLVIYLAVGGISYLGMLFLLKTVNIKEMKEMLK